MGANNSKVIKTTKKRSVSYVAQLDIEDHNDTNQAASTVMSPETNITSLPPEILINIFKLMNGKGLHDIDPDIFAAAEVCDIFKYIIYQVLFDIKITGEGITLGFDHYLQCRFEKLRLLHKHRALILRRISFREHSELERTNTLCPQINRSLVRQALVQPVLQLQTVSTSGNTTTTEEITDRYNIEKKQFKEKSENERKIFMKETKEVLGFQSTWGTRRKLVRGERDDWVWAEIVAARIESELHEAMDTDRPSSTIT